ncbi:MAG: hypothetical protein Q7T16_05410 [Candidatus Burarchaeum sp.]|nr:hypothetical protein [Candidatus Burarchaeum sp.]MDO8340065.1 hypothetical protein [Candidatus Burarchaeum sp.]
MRILVSFIPFLLSILLLTQISFALSGPGDSCNYTRDCETGYCLESVCTLPKLSGQQNLTSCASTANCSEGYCVDGTCILPTGRGDILRLGLKSGCAGLGEEFNSLGSFAICESIWFLVPILSLSAAYSSNRRGNRMLITAAVLLLPLFLAIVFLPFLGIIAALLELAVILGRKRQYS